MSLNNTTMTHSPLTHDSSCMIVLQCQLSLAVTGHCQWHPSAGWTNMTIDRQSRLVCSNTQSLQV